MAKTNSEALFHLDRPFDGKTLKKVFKDAGYTETALAGTLGISCIHERQDTEVISRRVKTDNPYNILFRLFWLGRPVGEKVIRKNLSFFNIEELEGTGLLICTDGMVRSRAKLGPYHELLMASDFEPGIHSELTEEHVLGVSAASITLANVTIRRKVTTALDLGTGAGIQAFLAANHVDRVIGTDTNSRALNFARFNARLNEINNVEWLKGSLYEPVAKEKFELIVSNPPFVISPESRFIFRDTNLPGDAISEEVLRGAGERLAEGGFACILFNWYHDETDWDSRPRNWISKTGCDGWLICFKTTDTLTYAADWLQTSVGQNSPDYGRLLDEWMEYYEHMGIKRISAGAMIMRRRSQQATWFRSHVLDKGRCMGSSGDQIERIFAAEDLLQALDDRQLLELRLLFDDHHRLEHQLTARDGRWVVNGEHLFASQGIPFAGNVDMHIANLLVGCNGKQTLRELIAIAASHLQTVPETIIPACLKAFRRLMQSGFLSAVNQTCESNL